MDLPDGSLSPQHVVFMDDASYGSTLAYTGPITYKQISIKLVQFEVDLIRSLSKILFLLERVLNRRSPEMCRRHYQLTY